MKLITYLTIKGNNIPSTAYSLFLINQNELLATPISTDNHKLAGSELHFSKFNDGNYYLPTSGDYLLEKIKRKLTKKVNNYCNVWLKHHLAFAQA